MSTYMRNRISFEIDGRCFEAVGYLNKGEGLTSPEIMFSRVAEENGGAIGEEDEAFLSERGDKFPSLFRRYFLVTNRRNLFDPIIISYFYWDDKHWRRGCDWCKDVWDDLYLVLRRCP